MRTFKIFLLALILITGFALNSNAAPITFIHQGIGTGYIGSESFTSSNFTITAEADTDDIYVIYKPNSTEFLGYSVNHTSVSIFVENLDSTYEFQTPTRTFVNNDFGSAGFTRVDGADLFHSSGTQALDVLKSWDMQSSIGPLESPYGQLLCWGLDPDPYGTVPHVYDIYNNIIFMDQATGADLFASSFTAITDVTAFPEPTTMLLLASGLL
ncbi:MAG TPA: hypothetical protein ENN61_04495, partial [Bacteroidaceae bacterium]|nr:hypothetical protein [Bacteroidaceae bacterium]